MAKEEKWVSPRTYWKRMNAKAPTELPKLAKKAKRCHGESVKKQKSALEYAKECGDALCEARKYFPTKGTGDRKWKDWLKRNFFGPGRSYETVKVYMRIARKWDDPRIRDIKTGAINAKSIQGFLRLLKYVKNADDVTAERQQKGLPPLEPSKKDELSYLRQCVRQECFSPEVRKWTKEECEVFIEAFQQYFWPRWYREVRKMVIRVNECSPYKEGEVDTNDVPFNDSQKDLNTAKKRGLEWRKRNNARKAGQKVSRPKRTKVKVTRNDLL